MKEDAFINAYQQAHIDGRLKYWADIITSMTSVGRKALLGLCRIQGPLLKRSRAYRTEYCVMIQDLLYTPFHLKLGSNMSDLRRTILPDIQHLMSRPYLCGLVAMLARCMPGISRDEAMQLLRESWEKEVRATQGLDVDAGVQYQIWLEDLDRTTRCSIGLTEFSSGRELNHDIYTALCTFRSKYTLDTVFYPVISDRKSMSRTTARAFWEEMGHPTNDCSIQHYNQVTSRDIQWWYHLTGSKIGGIVEVRQAFKHNDIKPRTYYCPGGICYWPSCHLQRFFSNMTDIFVSTNRYSRYNVTDFFNLSEADRIIMYDYTTFTSAMGEQKRFLERLAAFFGDIWITIFDCHMGKIQKNLGEMIREYNDVCNNRAEFSLERVLEGEMILRNIHAGFLGVFGNITTCTLLHGLGLCQKTVDMLNSRCVGDDAIGRFLKGESLQDILSHLRVFGSFEESKVAMWDHDDDVFQELNRWRFCKRPINRLLGRLEQGFLPDIPMAHLLFQMSSASFHTDTHTRYQRQKNFAVQTRRMIQVIQTRGDLDDDEEEVIRGYLRFGYKSLGLPYEGSLGFDTGGDSGDHRFKFVVPDITEDIRLVNPIDLLLTKYEGSIVSIPVFHVAETAPTSICPDNKYRTQRSQFWRFMVMFEYATQNMPFEISLLTGENLRNLRRFMNGDRSLSVYYDYTVLQYPPDSILQLL